MENFTNETIDTTRLPKFEGVQLSKLEVSYWKVLLIRAINIFTVVAVIFGLTVYFDVVHNHETLGAADYLSVKIAGIVFLFMLVLIRSRISYKKKAFAFRNHDVIYRSGIIATNTMVIPYNRVQHVALHEGFLSRYFGLASIGIYTAGGIASDIVIPGIDRGEAENIKQLLMGKIQKQL